MIHTNFAQDCPACSRQLRVRMAYLGRRVVCQHCQAEFTARETSSPNTAPGAWRGSLLQRADDLLRRVELRTEFA